MVSCTSMTRLLQQTIWFLLSPDASQKLMSGCHRICLNSMQIKPSLSGWERTSNSIKWIQTGFNCDPMWSNFKPRSIISELPLTTTYQWKNTYSGSAGHRSISYVRSELSIHNWHKQHVSLSCKLLYQADWTTAIVCCLESMNPYSISWSLCCALPLVWFYRKGNLTRFLQTFAKSYTGFPFVIE